MDLKCYKCGHSWNYKGKRKYLTCPNCLYKIRQDKAKVIVGKLPTIDKEKIPTINKYRKVIHEKRTDFIMQENKEGDKLMKFKDGLKVVIPRPEILLPMLENWRS